MAAVVVDRDAKASRGRALHRARHPGIGQVLHPPPGHILWAPRHQGMLDRAQEVELRIGLVDDHRPAHAGPRCYVDLSRSEEHTSELQSLMRISYAVFCLKTTNNRQQ